MTIKISSFPNVGEANFTDRIDSLRSGTNVTTTLPLELPLLPAGEAINAGAAIYESNGQYFNSVNNISGKDSVLGFSTTTVATAANVYAKRYGHINPISNDITNAIDDVMYLSNVAGKLTNVVPTTGNSIVIVGKIIKITPNLDMIINLNNGISAFTYQNYTEIATNGTDGGPSYIPSKTLAGAILSNPPPYTYALYPGSYDTVTNFNNVSIIGIDNNRTYLSCTTNSINITDGNMITNISNLTILKTATAGDAIKLSGNIGTINLYKLTFQVLSGNGSDINFDAVTGGTINLFNCTFTDENNLQLNIMSNVTACNINVYNAVGNLIFSSDGKVTAYIENSTVGTANHNGGIFDIQTSDLLGILSPALASDPGNALYFSNCDTFQTDNGAFTAILMRGGCRVTINNSNIDYNICNFGITPVGTTILQDTNRIVNIISTTAIKTISLVDNTFIIDGSGGNILLTFFATNNTTGLMTIRNFKFIRIDNSANLVQIQTVGSVDKFIGNYVGSDQLSTIGANSTVNVQVNFKTHQLLIY